jgi:hypothetical protein
VWISPDLAWHPSEGTGRCGRLRVFTDTAIQAVLALKVLGEGEWKVRTHGADKRRVWRKVHLVIDAVSHAVRAVGMMDHRHGDGDIVPGLLAQLPEGERIGVISGDGAYDLRGVYEASRARQADLVAPAAQR